MPVLLLSHPQPHQQTPPAHQQVPQNINPSGQRRSILKLQPRIGGEGGKGAKPAAKTSGPQPALAVVKIAFELGAQQKTQHQAGEAIGGESGPREIYAGGRYQQRQPKTANAAEAAADEYQQKRIERAHGFGLRVQKLKMHQVGKLLRPVGNHDGGQTLEALHAELFHTKRG